MPSSHLGEGLNPSHAPFPPGTLAIQQETVQTVTHSAVWCSRGLVRVARTDCEEALSALLLPPPAQKLMHLKLHFFLSDPDWWLHQHLASFCPLDGLSANQTVVPLPKTKVQEPLVSLCGSCLSPHSSQSRTQPKWNTMGWWLCLRVDVFFPSHLLSLHRLSLWHFPPTFLPQQLRMSLFPQLIPGSLELWSTVSSFVVAAERMGSGLLSTYPCGPDW